jgi:hypothetical protein
MTSKYPTPAPSRDSSGKINPNYQKPTPPPPPPPKRMLAQPNPTKQEQHHMTPQEQNKLEQFLLSRAELNFAKFNEHYDKSGSEAWLVAIVEIKMVADLFFKFFPNSDCCNRLFQIVNQVSSHHIKASISWCSDRSNGLKTTSRIYKLPRSVWNPNKGTS